MKLEHEHNILESLEFNFNSSKGIEKVQERTEIFETILEFINNLEEARLGFNNKLFFDKIYQSNKLICFRSFYEENFKNIYKKYNWDIPLKKE